ncbi:hypothetical protein [Arcticibacter eurypsychrophilus]|uniref:hypothetical protein n=1 Tax=Arcticibacter eurypsychrophilus TaxID=1434752 RepID=UPI00084DD674|nr:hypothetical protein [Arcticibacter eurypsychrophilus]
MKISYQIIISSLFLVATTSMVSCTSTTKDQKQVKDSVAKVVLPQPFHVHKVVEIKPGLTLDILSWGRGAKLSAAYLILRSDSLNNEYKSITGELDGKITDAWNMDMDSDGNPELFIQAVGTEKDHYLSLYVYEFSESGSYKELKFPDLTNSTKKLYRGKDLLYIKDGALFREFSLFDESDTAGTKPTGKKLLGYSIRGNSFAVNEIKADKKAD